MKVYNCQPPWPGKLNVIDETGAFVGYSFEPNCCEDFGYFFATKAPYSANDRSGLCEIPLNAKDYVFDRDYFLDLTPQEYDDADDEGYYNNAVCFRLTTKKGAELFLVLYNSHNGYYSHGFTFGTDCLTFQQGDL